MLSLPAVEAGRRAHKKERDLVACVTQMSSAGSLSTTIRAASSLSIIWFAKSAETKKERAAVTPSPSSR